MEAQKWTDTAPHGNLVMEPKKWADPSAVGNLGFAMATFMVSFSLLGWVHGSPSVIVVACGIFLGCLAQLFAGLIEFRNGNMFGATVFMGFGSMWGSLWIIFMSSFPGTVAAGAKDLGWYIALWTVFVLAMTIGTFKPGVDKVTRITFIFALCLFTGFTVMIFTGDATVMKLTAWFGILASAGAFYKTCALTLNATYEKTILPLF